jgi:hypothetical protein
VTPPYCCLWLTALTSPIRATVTPHNQHTALLKEACAHWHTALTRSSVTAAQPDRQEILLAFGAGINYHPKAKERTAKKSSQVPSSSQAGA